MLKLFTNLKVCLIGERPIDWTVCCTSRIANMEYCSIKHPLTAAMDVEQARRHFNDSEIDLLNIARRQFTFFIDLLRFLQI